MAMISNDWILCCHNFYLLQVLRGELDLSNAQKEVYDLIDLLIVLIVCVWGGGGG